jgi:hypothetical protein
MDAGPKAYASLFPVAQQQAAGVLPVLQAEIARSWASVNEEGSEEAKDRLAQRQARAAIALVRLGDADLVWPLLRHSADPRLRSFIVNWLNPGSDPKAMVAGGSIGCCLLPPPPPATLHPEMDSSPLPPRDLSPPRPDPGPGNLRGRHLLPRRSRAPDPQAARPLSQRPRRRHPRGSRMGPAPVEARRHARGRRCRAEPAQGSGAAALVHQ